MVIVFTFFAIFSRSALNSTVTRRFGPGRAQVGRLQTFCFGFQPQQKAISIAASCSSCIKYFLLLYWVTGIARLRVEKMAITQSGNQREGSLTWVVFLSVVATIGGFLFGFDSGVINGTVDALQKAFGSTAMCTGFNVSSMLIGCAAGAFFAATWGRWSG